MEVKTEHPLRFGIVPTYRCNLSCYNCNRHINLFKWQESENSVDLIRRAGEMVRAAGMEVHKVRLTGGEPTLHPDFVEIVQTVRKVWNPEQRIVVMTNGTNQPRPSLFRSFARYSHSSNGPKKAEEHVSYLVSPTDLGMTPELGVSHDCFIQKGCGRLFDAFGFSFCILAGAMGRFLRIDPYSPTPILRGNPDICRHCVCSLPRPKRWKVWTTVRNKELPSVTPTLAAGIQAFRESPFLFRRFEERSQ